MQHFYILNQLQNKVNSPCEIVVDNPQVKISR
nr:MAG TPA: hypothetical protein [Caudoviricetes sp.]